MKISILVSFTVDYFTVCYLLNRTCAISHISWRTSLLLRNKYLAKLNLWCMPNPRFLLNLR
jgi:hypothetical protein